MEFACEMSKTSSARTSASTSASTATFSDFSRSSSKSSEREHEQPYMLSVSTDDSWNFEIKNTFIHFGEIEWSCNLQRSVSAPALIQLGKEETDKESEGEPTMDLACSDEPTMDLARSGDKSDDGEEDGVLSPEEVAAARAAMEHAHYAGCCKPCQYFAFKGDSCRKGDSCLFCHLCTPEEVRARRKAQRRRNLQNSIAQMRTRGAGGKLPTRVTRAEHYNQAKLGARAPFGNVHASQLAPAVPMREVAPARAPRVGPSPGLREIAQPRFPNTVGVAPMAAAPALPPGSHWRPGLQTRVMKVAGVKVQIQIGALLPR